ncbi:hypothetical protein ACX80W_15685 [Arthrobacter sp. TMN-37]
MNFEHSNAASTLGTAVDAPPSPPGRPARKRSSRRVVWAAAAVVGVGAAAWVLYPGPLGRALGGVGVCVPRPADGEAAVGIVLINTSLRAITVERVELLEPRNLVLADTHLMMVPDGPGTAFGGGSTVPAPGQRQRWAAVEPAVGGEIPAGETGNIVVAVTGGPGNGNGVTETVLITYSTGLRSYTLDAGYTITLADECS